MAQVTRPKVDSALPSDLVGWATNGRIRIPAFQRSYRWDRHDVTRLFDSLFRGYPIGNLLVWQKPAISETIALGHLTINAPEILDAYWIIDGQQRIISLVGALTSTAETADPRFRIYFDLADGRFVSAGRNQKAPDDWMPVSLTLSTALVNSWLRARPQLNESQIALADQVVAAIRDYRIPMYIVTGDDEHALRDIFDRMNTYGQSLKSAEVFNALHSVSGESQPSDLHALASSVQKLGFGALPERLLMQSLLAIRGPRVDRDFRDEFTGDADRHDAFLATEEAIGHVVDFLREIADIPHIRLLPYSLFVPVLARFCWQFGPPRAKAAELLRRWIWRGSVLGVAPQGNTIGIRQGAFAIYEDPIASANRLLGLLPTRTPEWRPDLSQVGLNRAQAKVNILSMLSRRPRTLPADTLLSSTYVDALGLLETGQILTAIVPGSSRLGRGISNRMIYPATSFHRIRHSLLEADDETLESHCIDPQAARLLMGRRQEDFLHRRAATVSEVVVDHVQKRALFGFRDGPDLADLFDDVADNYNGE